MVPATFETHPSRYVHWKVRIEGAVAHLTMDVQETRPLVDGYRLKLNSYDLGVDIELADFVQRLRFEHPQVRVVVLRSGSERVFCAGANIGMLAASSHSFKVNFCKFTNETRLAIEDMSENGGVRWLAAIGGTCAGGGYELALACDEILLVDDGSSAVSLPEVPLLAVLPGTGGLTRLVDKRGVRRDRADVFSTLAEGIKGRRAVDWKLVDSVAARSRFDDAIRERTEALLQESGSSLVDEGDVPAVTLTPLQVRATDDELTYSHVEVKIDHAARTAAITVHAPRKPPPESIEAIVAAGADWWPLATARELDDALLRLRFHHEEINLLTLRTRGDAQAVLAVDASLEQHARHGFVREVILNFARVLRRLELTAKSLFAVVDEGSCFAGSLLELALAADRTYMLDDPDAKVAMALSSLNFGWLPMSHGMSRLSQRTNTVDELDALAAQRGRKLDAGAADEAGLVTVVADDLDFDDELRVAIEERASLSPDALTGMEASLRFAGPESMETKIFGRLSAWQNWIFTRPNATGESGALTRYGHPEKPVFDWRRT